MTFKIPNLYQSETPSKTFIDKIKGSQKNDHLIVLSGPTGTGKTYDACAWLRHLKKNHGIDGYYTKASEFWSMTPEMLYEISIKKCIVIDDYGKKQSVGNLERVSDIIDSRMEKEYPYTIITTNVLTEIENIDPRLYSRLKTAVIVDYTGLADRRQE